MQNDATIAIDIRIGEVDRQRRVIVSQIGAEQQRLHIVQRELAARQVARIVIEQTVGSARRSPDIAVTVQNDKGVIVFEDTTRPRRRARHWNIEWRLRDALDSFDLGLTSHFG